MGRNNAAYFGLGVVTGSAVTTLFFLFKEGVIFVGESQPTDEEVPAQEYDDSEKPISFKDVPASDVPSQVAYHDILRGQGYQTKDVATTGGIYAITEEEFFAGGDDGGFDMVTLTLYSDNVLADAVSDEILDPEDLVAVISFGSSCSLEELRRRFEDGADTLYFRNDRLLTQYEINFDNRTYREVTGQVTHG